DSTVWIAALRPPSVHEPRLIDEARAGPASASDDVVSAAAISPAAVECRTRTTRTYLVRGTPTSRATQTEGERLKAFRPCCSRSIVGYTTHRVRDRQRHAKPILHPSARERPRGFRVSEISLARVGDRHVVRPTPSG